MIRGILTIISTERKTLLKGMIISFTLIFPLTFLPAIIRNGFSITTIIERFNESILYTFGFSLIVLIAAVIHNYNELVENKWYFDKPAFKELDFYGRIDGKGSVVSNLETILLGKIDKYFFRLNLVNIEKTNATIEIVPLINLSNKSKEIDKLKKDYNFINDLFFGMRIKLSEINLEDSKAIRRILNELEKVLEKLNFESLDVDENELKMDL